LSTTLSEQAVMQRYVFLMAAALCCGAVFATDLRAQEAATKQTAGLTDDVLRVPDGSPEELLAFIEKIQKVPPAARDRASIVDYVRKVYGATVVAVDKIGDRGSEGEQVKAINEKLAALQVLRRVETEGADKQMRDYLATLAADKRSFVPPLAKVYHLATRLGEVDRGDHDSLEKLADEVREHVKTAKLDARNLNIAYQTASLLERAGLTKQALEAYVDFAAAFAASDDPKVRENAAMLEGSARYLALPGNAMDVKGKTVDGKEFDVKSWEGKVVLVDFWATWCGPCIAELPTLRDCYEKYHDRGFEVVGISLDSDRSRLDAFLAREELPWTTLFSADETATGWKHPLAAKYGVMSIPRGVLIDRKGKVVSLDAHGDTLWDLLATQIGPAEVKKEPKPEGADDAKQPGAAKPGAE
jgi:thiol-disulfide isomerase/thioredoxin